LSRRRQKHPAVSTQHSASSAKDELWAWDNDFVFSYGQPGSDFNETRIQLTVQGETLECKRPNGDHAWSCPVSSIVLVAEYTTDEGPWCDDYFLIFWTWEEGRLFRAQVTCSAHGTDQTVSDLSRFLQSQIDLKLTGSTDWNSRIMWPPKLAGHPYFTFVEAQPRNWRERLSCLLWGPAKLYFASDEVSAFLRHYNPKFKRQL